MHDDLEPFSQSPSQKFCKNLFDFEKPQNFSTNPKNWVRMHEMYDKRLEKRSYLWNMQWKDQRMSREDEEVEWEEFGSEREVCLSWEIEEKWDRNREAHIYRSLIILNRLRGVKKW